MTRYQRGLYAAAVVSLLASLVDPPFPDQMFLQHIPTVLILAVWPFLSRRFPLTDTAVSCLTFFLLLHILGARYIYSYVPYDRWTEDILSVSITEIFGFRRNHYDRLVHLSFGLLFVRPIWEIGVRYLSLPRRFAYYFAFDFVLATSMLYEVFEWGLSLVLAGPDADAYNGQQGDMWDAQKDMALALLGAATSLAYLYITRRRRVDVSQRAASRTS